MVEFALVIPVLAAIILGAVTTGLAYNVNNTLNSGARESARFAATSPIGGDMDAWLNEIADVAIRATSGELAPARPGQEICVAYVHPDGDEPADRTTALFEIAGSRTVITNQMCFDDGRPADEARVQVLLERKTEINAMAFTTTVDLSNQSVVRYERAR